ncbi:GNAT family N-acetyltransferase [Oceanobacillus massiliensis]|uniref:GNAT family N-acetyltransferase n=1 Tax=Oceanobacillus massiliensis TaxID=1465765 RepID=UPI000288F4C2|nr:GNAT family N-acetyltransferase [Oceanobacillus massiliensis]
MKEPGLFCETDRLIIRPYIKEDYWNWYTQFDNRLPSKHKYDEGHYDMSRFTEKWFIHWIRGLYEAAERDQFYIFGVFRKEDGVNLGNIEINTILRKDYHWAMMGYYIHNQFWKKGYGKEGVLAALQLFFKQLNYHRIELHINLDNEPSIRLAESTGFIYECTRNEFSYEDGKWTDLLIFYRNQPEERAD